MSKGDATREQILEAGHRLASARGLNCLTIGALAAEVQMSKSGLFSHFHSKENLQIAVLEYASARFTAVVLAPALEKTRGLPRLQHFFDRWCAWHRDTMKDWGGCIFVAAASEFDDEPGAVKAYLQRSQDALLQSIARIARSAVEERQFRQDVDVEQFSFDLYALMLGYHHFHRLLDDPEAQSRLRKGFHQILSLYLQRGSELENAAAM
jgi:AcrR family transcriptional regulator